MLRRGTIDDAARLSVFGARLFAETFGAANTPENLAAYLAGTYGEPVQRAELADPRMRTVLAEHGTEIVGYAQVACGPAPACVSGPSPVELRRIYVAPAWHGRGLAQRLMEAAEDAARELGGGTCWLGVWERNPRAIAFYIKCGFTDVGSHTFMLGSDAQSDRVMLKPL